MIEGLKPVRHEYRTHAQDSWYACTERQYRECEPMLGVGVGGGFRALYSEEQVRQLSEQRAELLEALRIISKEVFGEPGDEPDCYTDYDRLCELQKIAHSAIANATQQRNATGGEG